MAPKIGDSNRLQGETAWDAYWQRGGAAGHALDTGAMSTHLDRFWRDSLMRALEEGAPSGIVDLACGSGAVTRAVLSAAQRRSLSVNPMICLDYSATAARRAAGARARPVSAALQRLPLRDRSLDLVLSQYGIEYGGEDAFREAARIVAPGGALVALMHDAEGGVFDECRTNLGLFENVMATGVFEKSQGAFAAGFAADRDPKKGQAFAEAHKALTKAIRRLDALLTVDNTTDAMAFLRQVRGDLDIMFARRRAYAENEVMDWLALVSGEAKTYTERMQSMIGAARTEEQIIACREMLRSEGMEASTPNRLCVEPGGASLGWIIRASRP